MQETSTPGIYYYDLTMNDPGNYVFKVDSVSNPLPDMKSIYVQDLNLEEKYVTSVISGSSSSSSISGSVD